MLKLRVIRFFLALVLLAYYLSYITFAVLKLRKGQLGMSVVPEKRYLFEVPSVAFCALDITEARENEKKYQMFYPRNHAKISFDLDTSFVPPKHGRMLMVESHPEEHPVLRGLSGAAKSLSATRPGGGGADGGAEYAVRIPVELESGSMTLIPKNGQDCSKEHFGVFSRCLWSYASSGINCADIETGTSSCDLETGLKMYRNISYLLSKSSDEVQKITNCLAPCEEDTFTIGFGKSVVVPRSQEDNYTHKLEFYIPKPIFTVKEEYLVYDEASFLADCGGMGGILLGFSLLSFYDWVAESRLARVLLKGAVHH